MTQFDFCVREARQNGLRGESEDSRDFQVTQPLEVEQIQDQPAIEGHTVQCFQDDVWIQRGHVDRAN